jgi:heptosyltransferase-2
MMASLERILIIRLSSVGDIVLATPFLQVLRERYPAAQITWLVDRGYSDLLCNNPHLDQVIEFDLRGRHRGTRGIMRLAGEVGGVDWVIDLQHKVRTIALSALLRPERTSVFVKRRGLDVLKAILGRDPVYTDPHQILRYLRLLYDQVDHGSCEAALEPPAPRLWLDTEVLNKTALCLAAETAGSALLGLVLGSRHTTKRWPDRHLARLVDLASGLGWRSVLLGGEEEREAAAMVTQAASVGLPLVMVGGSLMQLAAAIACCSVVVAPDSGPAHMAAALGIPVVTLFGPTSPARWAPRGRHTRVVRLELPCSPCSNIGRASCPINTRECLDQLTAERVFSEVQSLLREVK